MKSIEDFVIWALNQGCSTFYDLHRKLGRYGFDNQDIDEGVMSLIHLNKVQVKGSGTVTLLN